ncbi:hypothetical protein TWF730_008906 [Orbilia blumenaviensis]|uniref:C2H2-type domain-containing protein n=1 Tax=Orbilia blumenaviensis TaxID=1796055 RepID=A0AAV9V018_9PEZI
MDSWISLEYDFPGFPDFDDSRIIDALTDSCSIQDGDTASLGLSYLDSPAIEIMYLGTPDPKTLGTTVTADSTGRLESNLARDSSIENFQTTKPCSRSKGRKGSKTYCCDICSIPFSNRKTYGDHMRSQHGISAFKCHHCDTHVARYDNLRSHTKRCKGLRSQLGKKRHALMPPDVDETSATLKNSNWLSTPDMSTKPSLVKLKSAEDAIVTTPDSNATGTPQFTLCSSDGESSQFILSSSDGENSDSLVLELQIELKKSKGDIALLRDQVSLLEEERNVWKRNYLELKTRVKVK